MSEIDDTLRDIEYEVRENYPDLVATRVAKHPPGARVVEYALDDLEGRERRPVLLLTVWDDVVHVQLIDSKGHLTRHEARFAGMFPATVAAFITAVL